MDMFANRPNIAAKLAVVQCAVAMGTYSQAVTQHSLFSYKAHLKGDEFMKSLIVKCECSEAQYGV